MNSIEALEVENQLHQSYRDVLAQLLKDGRVTRENIDTLRETTAANLAFKEATDTKGAVEEFQRHYFAFFNAHFTAEEIERQPVLRALRDALL